MSISPTAKQILTLLPISSPDISNAEIANEINRLPRTVQKGLHELQLAGLVRIEHHRAQAPGETARTIHVNTELLEEVDFDELVQA